MKVKNGFKVVTEKELGKIETPVVCDDASWWKPLPHLEVAQAVEKTLDDAGVRFGDPVYRVSKDDMVFVAEYLIDERTDIIPAHKEVQHRLAVVHSNNKKIALKVLAGAEVFVCSNGMIVGERLVSKLHSKNLDLFDAFREALDSYVLQANAIPGVIDSFKATEIRRDMADHLLMEAGRNRLISWANIGKVVAELKNPTFSAFSDESAWSLYNAFTHVLKNVRQMRQIKSNQAFFNMVNETAVHATIIE